MTSRHRLNGLSGAESARSGREYRSAHRYPDDRYPGDNRSRENNAKTSDQAPLTPTATSPSPVSRQGNPFVRPYPPDTRCRLEEATAFRLRVRAVTRRGCQHAAPDLVRHGGHRAQVPLALKNARKTPQTCGTCARNSAAGLPNDQRLWPLGNSTLRNQYKSGSHNQHIRTVVISISLNISYADTPSAASRYPITVRDELGSRVGACGGGPLRGAVRARSRRVRSRGARRRLGGPRWRPAGRAGRRACRCRRR